MKTTNALTRELLERLQHTVRSRVLRHYRRHGLLEPHEPEPIPNDHFDQSWGV